MNADELVHEIDLSFGGIPRPDSFTTCHCEECSELDRLLNSRTYATVKLNDFEMSLSLLSPEGRTYWAPALMKLCLVESADVGCDTCDQFVNWELGQPLSKSKFPAAHPKFSTLTPQQTNAVLEFLRHFETTCYNERGESIPRELARALDNWSRLAGVDLKHAEKGRNNAFHQSDGG